LGPILLLILVVIVILILLHVLDDNLIVLPKYTHTKQRTIKKKEKKEKKKERQKMKEIYMHAEELNGGLEVGRSSGARRL
jgi:predicted Holliday junction resolvase-like endonuclease